MPLKINYIVKLNLSDDGDFTNRGRDPSTGKSIRKRDTRDFCQTISCSGLRDHHGDSSDRIIVWNSCAAVPGSASAMSCQLLRMLCWSFGSCSLYSATTLMKASATHCCWAQNSGSEALALKLLSCRFLSRMPPS